jgi:hypothetical protein
VDREAAVRKVAADLHLLRAQFETLPQLIDDIDDRNARFSGVALRKIMYLLRQDKRIEGQLQLVIDRLARDEAPGVERKGIYGFPSGDLKRRDSKESSSKEREGNGPWTS